MRLFAGLSAFFATASVVIVLAAGPDFDGSPSQEKKQAAPAKQASAAADAIVVASRKDDPFIVHEWGTFTSFSGSDGVRLEFRPLADEDLPPFVLDRFLQSGLNSFRKAMVRTRLRMETPVTYFYTERERDVNVRVDFPEGLLTEFFPPVRSMSPDFKPGEALPIRNSSLDWGQVHLIPQNFFRVNIEDRKRAELIEQRMLSGLTPKADGQNHYFHARETDSAIVQVHLDPDPKLPLRPSGDFFEKFLFYRGIGNFELPLKLTATGDGQYELLNSGPDAVRSLFLVTADGSELRFAKFDQIAAGQRRTLTQGKKPATMNELSEAVIASLVDEKLYEKEARAMVKTWQSSWFGETGTRLFYMVPTPVTEQLLPLTVEPKPDETVRVLVGRMEIMTPETEKRVLELVRASYAARVQQIKEAHASRKPVGAIKWPARLTELGRLTEPALARIRSIAPELETRIFAGQLLTMLPNTDLVASKIPAN
jgi:hypothetical protein